MGDSSISDSRLFRPFSCVKNSLCIFRAAKTKDFRSYFFGNMSFQWRSELYRHCGGWHLFRSQCIENGSVTEERNWAGYEWFIRADFRDYNLSTTRNYQPLTMIKSSFQISARSVHRSRREKTNKQIYVHIIIGVKYCEVFLPAIYTISDAKMAKNLIYMCSQI